MFTYMDAQVESPRCRGNSLLSRNLQACPDPASYHLNLLLSAPLPSRFPLRQPWRPALAAIFDDYWRLMPQYQDVPLADLQVRHHVCATSCRCASMCAQHHACEP